ncbi:acyl-CoA desaturase, partial [Candidatus Uhrbacteria bacterium]|nr:acyl-CoA desaturase [Candidatus Uhrbacteria bacterium]
FAHRTYKLNRFWQFVLAFGAETSAQKGVLWWAGYHRHHHRTSDQPTDIHSPLRGFWWSHVGWILCDKYKVTPYDDIQDFAKYPEIRWLSDNDLVPPTVLALLCLFFFGLPGLMIGFFASTVVLWHGTFFINSLTHIFGRRRYVTNDSSRNSAILAFITLGEGWHNNHHHYQSAARQGHKWWEFDFTFYGLKMMSWIGIVKNIRPVLKGITKRKLIKDGHFDIGMFQTKLAKATDIIVAAKESTGDYYGERRIAIETFVVKTKEQAEVLARKSQKYSRPLQKS